MCTHGVCPWPATNRPGGRCGVDGAGRRLLRPFGVYYAG